MTFSFPTPNVHITRPTGNGSVLALAANRDYGRAVDGFLGEIRTAKNVGRRLRYIDSYLCPPSPGRPAAMCLMLAVRSAAPQPPSAFVFCKRYERNNESLGRLIFSWQGWLANVDTQDKDSFEFYKQDRFLIVSEISRICNTLLDVHHP